MLGLIKKGMYSNSALALYAQACMLLANFVLFVVLIKGSYTASYGHWALFITIISIADSFRQGFLQNGFIRLFVKGESSSKSLVSSAALMNFGFIVLIGLIMWLAGFFQQNVTVSELLHNGFKSLLALGSLQFINMLCIARQDFKRHFQQNGIYLISFSLGLLLLSFNGQMGFIQVINLQLIASLTAVIYHLIQYPPAFARPSLSQLKSLWDFGRYAAGTNLLSMLFHKADILMLAFFTSPVTVAVFHFASKIVAYTDLPLNACSQVIYPELVASHRRETQSHLKATYLKSILRLLALSIPLLIMVILFNEQIITLLSTDDYSSSSVVIIILCLGCIVKPIGRVFGQLLDAMGKPQINFQMLSFSLVINVLMNLIFIPSLGLTGAALATSISIMFTVALGQWRLQKWLPISLRELQQFLHSHRPKLLSLKLKL